MFELGRVLPDGKPIVVQPPSIRWIGGLMMLFGGGWGAVSMLALMQYVQGRTITMARRASRGAGEVPELLGGWLPMVFGGIGLAGFGLALVGFGLLRGGAWARASYGVMVLTLLALLPVVASALWSLPDAQGDDMLWLYTEVLQIGAYANVGLLLLMLLLWPQVRRSA